MCSHPGCPREAHAKGLCQKHYDQIRRAGHLASSRPVSRICKVPGCGKPFHAHGLCQKHYDIVRKRPGAAAALTSVIVGGAHGDLCRVPGCGRPHHAKGYCKTHYSRLRRSGGLSGEMKPEGLCIVEGCSRPAVADGRCEKHLGHPATPGPVRILSKSERLRLIKQRHETMKREIAMINQALEDED
jgi:hypothetical protein